MCPPFRLFLSKLWTPSFQLTSLAELHESNEPVLITEHGQPSAYLIDVDDYELMQARMNILEGIARGEKAIFENRTMSQAEAIEKMSKWLK
jgi:PHD/YefM family antitoxin component YafN of YafNO toxin-antitoxin module